MMTVQTMTTTTTTTTTITTTTTTSATYLSQPVCYATTVLVQHFMTQTIPGYLFME